MKAWITLLVLISAAVSAQDSNCKTTQSGKEFKGKLSSTQSGVKCQRWDAQSPHKHQTNIKDLTDESLEEAADYCRNPGGHPGGPWCYTTDPNIEWQYCDVPMCGEKNCKMTKLGMEYRGKTAFTTDNKDCQQWHSQSPHKHNLYNDAKNFPDATIKDAANFCRNPDIDPGSGPWCYTNVPGQENRWRYCNVPMCEEVVLVIQERNPKVYVMTEDLKVTSGAVPDIPVSECYWAAGPIDNKVMIGGENSCHQISLGNLTWQKAPCSVTGGWEAAACVHDNSLYLFGGLDLKIYNQISSVEKYDGAKWSLATAMPERVSSQCAVEHKGSIYIIGGWADITTKVDRMRRFDPSSGDFVDMAPMLKAARAPQCAVVKIDGVEGILVVGERDVSTQLYSFTTGKWSMMANMNKIRHAGGLVYLGNRPVVFGGHDMGWASVDMEVYNEEQKKWTVVVNSTFAKVVVGYVKIPASVFPK